MDVAREMYDDDGLSDIDALASHCQGPEYSQRDRTRVMDWRLLGRANPAVRVGCLRQVVGPHRHCRIRVIRTSALR